MRVPVRPFPDIPGDSDSRIMARTGECLGFDKNHSVWRFGFMKESELGKAFGVSLPMFVWILATRKTGKVKETFHGFALELPANFRRVIERDYGV